MAKSLTRGEIKMERLQDGRVQLTHPSGVVVVEDWDLARLARVEAVRDAEDKLERFDALKADVDALTPVATHGGSL